MASCQRGEVSSCSAAARHKLRQPSRRPAMRARCTRAKEPYVSGHEAVIRMDQLPGTAVRICLLEDRMGQKSKESCQVLPQPCLGRGSRRKVVP